MTHLLIVSPNSLQANVVSLALQHDNVEITLIDNTQCIIKRCQDIGADMIIFLTLSPYFTSMNIVDELRASLKRLPAIYVISNSHSASVVLTLLECGVNQYLTFPLNLYRLRDKVYGELKID
ncbi:MAG: hypothetical protein SNI51_03995 [Rikenellaceae bacterium]